MYVVTAVIVFLFLLLFLAGWWLCLQWEGPGCATLGVEPVASVQGYGMTPNLTSWGGNVIYFDGLYHLYVAEMVNDCPLSEWGLNSQVSHAVSSKPTGPYAFKDVAVPVWAHNPQALLSSKDGKPLFVIFHIGSGTTTKAPKNCTHYGWQPQKPADPAGSTLHVATSPDGPWQPVTPSPPSCNNPAPLQHPNGTWYLLCGSKLLFRAPALTGPWTQVAKVPHGGVPGTYEDAFIFIDKRGHWHALFHVYNATTPCGACDGSMVSAHDYSEDGITWTASSVQPFSNQYTLTTGGTVTLSTRERPKLLFAADGTPTHLINGVCHAVTCPPTPGVVGTLFKINTEEKALT